MANTFFVSKNTISLFNISDNIINGKTVTKDGIRTLDKNVINAMNSLKLGENYIKLKSNNEYEIIRDLDSNLIHYFKDGKENIDLFISTNTTPAILFKKLKKNNKLINLTNKVLIILETGLLIIAVNEISKAMYINSYTEEIDTKDPIFIETNYKFTTPYGSTVDNNYPGVYDAITLERFEELISSNPNLTDEQKAFLNNEQLFKDLLPFYEESSFKYLVEGRLTELSLQGYSAIDYPGASGYYIPTDNKLYILHYDENLDFNYYKDTLAHEFVHLLQCNYKENYFIEALAEIISYEYFDGVYVETYMDNVANTRLLMEIIGPDPLLQFMVSNDMTPILDALKDYLTENDINALINIVTSYSPLEIDEQIHYDLRNILTRAYENKYNTKDKDLFSDIANNTINRYYFNTQYRDNQNLNYYTSYEGEEFTILDALAKKYIYLNNIANEEKTYEEYLEGEFIIFDYYFTPNNITFYNTDIIITDIKKEHNIFGGVDITNSTVSYIDNGTAHTRKIGELYDDGLINITVPRTYIKESSYEEFLKLSLKEKAENLHINFENEIYSSIVYADLTDNTIKLKSAKGATEVKDLPPLPGHTYNDQKKLVY